jgi:endoglucanase
MSTTFGLKAQVYNYAEALQKSLYFYDAEKSGIGVTGGRLPWRGDSEKEDAKVLLNTTMTDMSQAFINANKAALDPENKGYVDVSGGFHDAGDHVKFGLPQSYSSSNIEWALYEFKNSFVQTGEYEHIRDLTKWFSDYYLRCTFMNPAGEVVAFCYQVGEGNSDHTVWGPPEIIDRTVITRPGYFGTSEKPASDQAAGAAASLALSYLNDKDDNPAYADKCLTTAVALYKFAVKYRGMGFSGGFYNSSYDEDELSWAAIWLNVATNDPKYIDDVIKKDAAGMYKGWLAKIINSSADYWQNIWVNSWDTKWGGVFAKLAPITNDPFYWSIFRWNLEYWSGVPHASAGDTNYLTKTPAGFSFLNSWGSARYNAAAQFQAVVYKKYANNSDFDAWTQSQMKYIMGNNPNKLSYIVGYGNSVKHPHHRAAHGSSTNSMFVPENHKHILYGALVGGPGAADEHKDLTSDFVYNEVAIDYNAGLVGALAGLYNYFGAGMLPIPNFKPVDPPLIENAIEAKIEQENNERSQISIRVTNDPAYPPRPNVALTAKYYFNITELKAVNQTIADVSVVIYYDENANFSGPVKVNGPLAIDEANGLYCLEFTWPEKSFFGKRDLQFGLLAKQDPATWKAYWDPTNDYGHTGLTKAFANTVNIPLYVDGKLAIGKEPIFTDVPVTGVTLAPESGSVNIGSTVQLTPTVLPADASNKTVSYVSSNPLLASVSSTGLVTGIAEGIATITVTTQDGGKTATSNITVTNIILPPPVLTSMTVSPSTSTINIGETKQFTFVGKDQYGAVMVVNPNWSVDNAGSISATGLFTGTTAGTFIIKAQSGIIFGTAIINVNGTPAFAIPGKIEAEAYNAMQGIQKQATTDAGGGQNIGYVDAGDWLDYNVNVSDAGKYNVSFRVASQLATGAFQLKVGATILTPVKVPNTGGWQNWQTVTVPVNLLKGIQTMRILATGSGLNINWLEFKPELQLLTSIELTPLNSTINIGQTKQFTAVGKDQYGAAMAFTPAWSADNGGIINGTGLFSGTTPGIFIVKVESGTVSTTTTITVSNNTAFPIPGKIEAEAYNAMQGIQTQPTTDTGGGLCVGYIDAGDWLDYNVNVSTAGKYNVSFRVSSQLATGAFQLKIGTTVLTTVKVPNSGGWQTWQTLVAPVTLVQGIQTMRILAIGSGFNINWFSFAEAPFSIKIEAESYTSMFGIQTETTTDAGGGLDVGYTNPGDYMDYVTTIPSAGVYTVNFRVASNVATGKFELRAMDSYTENKLAISSGTTGGWQNWVTKTGTIYLIGGYQTIKIYYTGAGLNLNWFEIVSGGTKSSEINQDFVTTPTDITNIYPNPVSDELHIQSTKEQIDVTIFNLSGKTVLNTILKSGNNKLNISNLENGYYLIKTNGSYHKFVKK